MDYSRALAMDVSCIAFRAIARWATGLLTEIESTVLKAFERLSVKDSLMHYRVSLQEQNWLHVWIGTF